MSPLNVGKIKSRNGNWDFDEDWNLLRRGVVVWEWNGMAVQNLNFFFLRKRGKATELHLKACHAGLLHALLLIWRPVCVSYQWLKALWRRVWHAKTSVVVLVSRSGIIRTSKWNKRRSRSKEENSLTNSSSDEYSIPSYHIHSSRSSVTFNSLTQQNKLSSDCLHPISMRMLKMVTNV